MSKKTEAELAWAQIKTETTKKANSATRVGSAGLKIIEAIGALAAPEISYDNPTYPSYKTVAAALDKLLYVTPSISAFTATPCEAEIGQTINDVKLAWTNNKTMTAQSINNDVGAVTGSSISLDSQGLTVTTTWRITVGDGTNIAYKDTSLTFYSKRYWGVSAEPSLTDAQILTLSGEYATARTQTRTLNANGGKYLYFIMPTSFDCDISKFKLGGLDNNAWKVTTRAFINASSKSVSYMIFRSTDLQNSTSINVQIV